MPYGSLLRRCSLCDGRLSAENRVARAKRLNAALGQNHDVIDRPDRAGPVCEHDGDAAARTYGGDRMGERLFAAGGEGGIRLVEDDQKRVSIKRASQRHALTLSTRATA